MNSEESIILKKLEVSEKEFENKMKTFENKIVKLNAVIEEKDSKIDTLEKKLSDMINKFTEFTKSEEIVKKNNKKKECPHCDFVASSAKGLKTHITRIHTISKTINEVEFPKKCDLCDYVQKDKSEMKLHLKSHSYKTINFQCKECDFFCETQSEMELHIGRKHSDQLECGICNYEADNLENLTIHLATCEIYKCEDCELKVKTLNEVKNHVEKEHLTRIDFNFIYIMHIKQNRTDCEVIDETSHKAIGLFPELKRK